MSKKKKILFINPGWEQQPLADYFYKKNYFLIAVLEKKNEFIKNFKKTYYSDLRDLDKILNFAKEIKPDAVISDQCDYSMMAQAMIAENLKLKGPSFENAQVSSNKLIQRRMCKKLGIRIPKFICGHTLNEVTKKIKKLNYPLIIKPIDNRGSFGVFKLNNQNDLSKFFYKSISMSHSRMVIVEEFIDGLHLTVDGYIFPDIGAKSMACASKKLINKKKQVAMDIIYPAEIKQKLKLRVMELNEKINTMLGFKFGLTHTEYMMTPKGQFYLIESANRGGGCFTSQIILPYHSNFNLFNQIESDIFGLEKFTSIDIRENPVILKFFRIGTGKIKKIIGIKNINKFKNILKFRLNFNVNDEINEISNDGNRHGFIIMKGNKNNLLKNSKNIIKKIKVEYFNT